MATNIWWCEVHSCSGFHGDESDYCYEGAPEFSAANHCRMVEMRLILLRRDRVVILEHACSALVNLVRNEYPADRTLAEIATTWGYGISDEQIEALAVLDEEYATLPLLP